MKIVALRTHHMLCISGGEDGLGSGGGTNDAGIIEAGSRWDSVWDDEDDE